jgi:hypothetical protein
VDQPPLQVLLKEASEVRILVEVYSVAVQVAKALWILQAKVREAVEASLAEWMEAAVRVLKQLLLMEQCLLEFQEAKAILKVRS